MSSHFSAGSSHDGLLADPKPRQGLWTSQSLWPKRSCGRALAQQSRCLHPGSERWLPPLLKRWGSQDTRFPVFVSVQAQSSPADLLTISRRCRSASLGRALLGAAVEQRLGCPFPCQKARVPGYTSNPASCYCASRKAAGTCHMGDMGCDTGF